MDFLNQAIGQLRDLFASMTPAARITAVLLAAVIGVSLGYLAQHHSGGPDDYLFNGGHLTSDDVDRAVGAIAQAGLMDFVREGNHIKVPRAQKTLYLAAVADAGALPPNFHSLLEKALDLSPFTSNKARQQRIDSARQQMLSMMIREMTGIEDAKVMFDVSQARGLSRKREVTATVSIRPSPGEPVEARRLNMIRRAVAGAIAGLSPDDVTIADVGDGTLYGNGAGGAAADMLKGPYWETKIAYEQLMKHNIEELLRYIPGVRIQVAAALEPTIERVTKSVKPEGEEKALSTSKTENTSITRRRDSGGRVGLTAQGPNPGGVEQATEAFTENETTDTTTEADNMIGHREELLKEAGLIPKQVRASIAVPSDYIAQVWREKQNNKPDGAPAGQKPSVTDLINTEGELKQNIETIVAKLLPKLPGEDQFPNIAFTVFQSLPSETIEPPSTAGQALSWASLNFNTIAMVGLALFSLLMLRSMVKSIPATEPVESLGPMTIPMPTGTAQEKTAAGPASSAGAVQEEKRTRLRLNKGPNIKEDLSEIIRDDPDAAATILRNWISNAG